MQAVNSNTYNDTTLETNDHAHVQLWGSVGVETLVIIAIVCLALFLRVTMLDVAPMSDNEANTALTAWQVVHPDYTGASTTPSSAWTFWAQVVGFSMVGSGEFAARIVTALVGVVLVCLPLLFRAQLGAVRTLAFMTILAFSPVTLAASRTSDPMIWTAIFSIVLLWAIMRYWQHRQLSDVTLIGVCGASVFFLSGASGVISIALIALALLITAWWTALHAPVEMDVPSEEVLGAVRGTINNFAYGRAFLAMVLTTFFVATGFMFYPNMGVVAQGIGEAIVGVWQPYREYMPLAYPLVIVVVYDLLLPVTALVTAFLLSREQRLGADDRFALVLAGVSALVLLFYRGASPAFALLITIPLGYIVAHGVSVLLQDRETFTYWDLVAEDRQQSQNQYGWVKWVLVLLVVGAFVMLGTHWQEATRGFLTFDNSQSIFDNLPKLTENANANALRSLVWVIISLLFVTVGGFLVASIWGNYVAIQGLGLGVFAAMMVSGMGGGWNAVVPRQGDIQEVWQDSQATPDAVLLRRTLLDFASRNTQLAPLVEVAVVQDETINVSNRGIVAWLLRDFVNTRYVSSLEEAKQAQVVILSALQSTDIDLGGSYVGQSFALRRNWSSTFLSPSDALAWLAQRLVRENSTATPDTVVLWVRLDVYNANPIETVPNP
jgi:hypothetical protein